VTSLASSNTSVDAGHDRDAHTARTLDRIAHLAALATGASIAQINVLAEDGQVPIAVHFDPTRAPRVERASDGTARTAVDLGVACFKPDLDDESFAVEDTRSYSSAEGARDDADDGVRAYAAARLRTPAGVVLGTVCVADFAPRLWTPSEREALAECAALAGEELASQMSYVSAARARVHAERARADAETASRARNDFMDTLSRELRSQLEQLGGYVELLETGMRESQSAIRQDELRRLQLGQRHLVGLVDEVLSYAALERGIAAFQLIAINVHDVLVEAEAAIAPHVRGKALFLSLGDTRRDLAVKADAGKVRQILASLLSNAVRFTGAGGRIDVAADATRTDVRIRIHDTGVGIPADKLDVIFEPFVQLSGDPDRAVNPHAGLGLAISRALARAQGGDLTAVSTVGAGSTFTLTLPRAKRSN
jgi:signal transduction histidine kinase